MRGEKQLPRPLNEVLGRKLVYWLCDIYDRLDREDDFQEKYCDKVSSTTLTL